MSAALKCPVCAAALNATLTDTGDALRARSIIDGAYAALLHIRDQAGEGYLADLAKLALADIDERLATLTRDAAAPADPLPYHLALLAETESRLHRVLVRLGALERGREAPPKILAAAADAWLAKPAPADPVAVAVAAERQRCAEMVRSSVGSVVNLAEGSHPFTHSQAANLRHTLRAFADRLAAAPQGEGKDG